MKWLECKGGRKRVKFNVYCCAEQHGNRGTCLVCTQTRLCRLDAPKNLHWSSTSLSVFYRFGVCVCVCVCV